MDWVEITVHTTTEASDAVSELLIRQGATGTMVEDRADVPDPDKPNGFWEIIDPKMIEAMPEDVLVHAWFEPDSSFADRMLALRSSLDAMKAPDWNTGTLKVDSADVHDEDWSEVWKRFYKPFKAGEHLVVKPTWESYEPQEGDKIIEIDPGMAFGSGMHETTSMCLELLEKVIHGGEEIIDMGTGSGILAIGAVLLGAEKALAIDIDPVAVRVAAENIEHNGLQDKITAEQGDLLEKTDAVCDVCVANIIADIIIRFAEPVKQRIASGGYFICSGIIKERGDEVEQAVKAAGYEILEVRRRGEWVAILSRRP